MNEGSKEAPVQVTQFEIGTMLDTLAVSPEQLATGVLDSSGNARRMRSRIELVNTDGTGGRVTIGDGQSLDLTPVFTPAAIRLCMRRTGTKDEHLHGLRQGRVRRPKPDQRRQQ